MTQDTEFYLRIIDTNSATKADSLFYRSSARRDALANSQKNFQENYAKSLDHESGIFKQVGTHGY